jgi:hypothetical protein
MKNPKPRPADPDQVKNLKRRIRELEEELAEAREAIARLEAAAA